MSKKIIYIILLSLFFNVACKSSHKRRIRYLAKEYCNCMNEHRYINEVYLRSRVCEDYLGSKDSLYSIQNRYIRDTTYTEGEYSLGLLDSIHHLVLDLDEEILKISPTTPLP